MISGWGSPNIATLSVERPTNLDRFRGCGTRRCTCLVGLVHTAWSGDSGPENLISVSSVT